MKKIITLFLIFLCGGALLMGQESSPGKKYLEDVLPQESFKGSEKLKTIILPESLVKVEERAFTDCPRLEQVLLLTKISPQWGNEALPDQNLSIYVPTEEIKKDLMQTFHFAQTQVIVGRPQGVDRLCGYSPLRIAIEANTLMVTSFQKGELCLYNALGELLWQVIVEPLSVYSQVLPFGVYFLQLNDQVQVLIL